MDITITIAIMLWLVAGIGVGFIIGSAAALGDEGLRRARGK